LLADPGKWHAAHTVAFAGSVVVCVSPEEERHGFCGWGDWTPAPWHAALFRQDTSDPSPVKSAAWQIRQETKPDETGARLAEAPWAAGKTHPETVPWWQLAAFWKQETPAIPPVRASPWHVVHWLTSDTAKVGWVERKSTGWVPPPGPGIKLEVVFVPLEQPARKRTAQNP